MTAPHAASPSFNSTEYWRERYRSGGNSGAGSYGRLAVYKAHEVNRIAYAHKIKSVMELGSGDGANAALYSLRNYTGVDVSAEMVAKCNAVFEHKSEWTFKTLDSFLQTDEQFQMTMSLDVIYHLIEDAVFNDYMTTLFSRAKRLVLIYSTNHDKQAPVQHVRHRQYTPWISENQPEWTLLETMTHPFPRTETSNPDSTALAFFQLFGRR